MSASWTYASFDSAKTGEPNRNEKQTFVFRIGRKRVDGIVLLHTAPADRFDSPWPEQFTWRSLQ